MLGDSRPGTPRPHISRIPSSREEARKSFQNLVSLVNDYERWDDVTKKGRELVWRDSGEPPVLLECFRACVEHAGAGGLRAGILGFSARSGVNLFMLFFTLTRTSKRLRGSLVIRALFNADSLHFGAMLGAFVAIYKFILNALPILSLRMAQHKRRQLSSESSDLARGARALSSQESRLQGDSPGHLPYTNSDVEEGLSMETLKKHKSALKQPAAMPDGSSSLSSVESSPPGSPNQSPKGEDKQKRARFADGDDLVQTAPQRQDSYAEYTGHLSTSTRAAFVLMKEKGYVYKRWHATIAGAVAGGIAILFEKKSRRLSISQQMFVRGLQGSFNFWSKRFGIRVPFGSVWVFALCCGQIMYGFLLRPDTIPKSYETWIQKASVVPDAAVQINRQLIYEGTLNINLQKKLARGFTKPWYGSESTVTEENRMTMIQQVAKAAAGEIIPPMASCAAIHPHHNRCIPTGIWRVYESGKWMAPMYGALHFIPILLFKRKALMRSPFETLVKALLGTIRSSAFLGVYVAIYQSYICFLHFLYRLPLDSSIAPAFKRFILSKPLWWFGGILSGMSLFVEDARRREELAMYVLPKGLESGWKLLRSEVFGIPTQRKRRGWKGDVALCAAGMAMVMSTYQDSPQHLSGLVRRLLYQFVGPN